MLYKARRANLCVIFYGVHMKLRYIYIFKNNNKYTPLFEIHTRATPVRACFIRLAMYAAWHAHKGLITLDRTIDRLDKVQTTVKANKT